MRRLIMRAGACLICCGQLVAPVYAADAKAKKTTAATVSRVQTRPAPPVVASATSKATESDSRANDYRLERESCCGPQ